MEGLERLAILAKNDENSLAELVESQKQWILRTASRSVGRYITDSDDEWSTALLAFTEAVRDYEEEKGSFPAFASVVIRRRLLDQLRSDSRRSAELTVTPAAFEGSLEEDEAGGLELRVQGRVAEEAAREAARADTLAEIETARELLEPYGISFFELAEASPKAEKTKRACRDAVRALLADELLLARLRKARALPIKELSAASGVQKKILDRHRRYIIAAAELLAGDFPIIADYLDYIRRG